MYIPIYIYKLPICLYIDVVDFYDLYVHTGRCEITVPGFPF